jgi:ubiquinone/menaquinone biosynthesis C-methylase UbiE
MGRIGTVGYEQQKNHWDRVAKRRDPDHPVVRAFAEPKLRFILEHLPPRTQSRSMLEVGAGNGFFSLFLEKAFILTCLDFSRNMLEMNPLPWKHKVLGDAEALPFPADHFDVVFCGNLLHHLEDPIVAVREMRRVAREHVILIEPNVQNPLMAAFGLIKREEWGTLKFNSRYLKRLGDRAGLLLRIHRAQGSVVPNKTPRALLPLLSRFDGASPIGFYHVAIFDV